VLPLCKTEIVTALWPAISGEVLTEAAITFANSSSTSGAGDASLPITSRADSVLVADDDPLFRKMLETSLRKWKLDVITARDGLEAWKILEQDGAPKLVVLDWMMPGLDGIEICQRIRNRQAAPYSYVLLLTSRDEKRDLLRGLEVGADDYLTKPFDPSELQARLKTGLRILELQDELLQKEAQLRFEASHDRLTGLWNRGAILDFLQRELARAQRSNQPLGVAMLDVDHFKEVNDTYGHLVGDAILEEVARRLAGAIRQYDWVGRYGGEEFLAIINAKAQDDMARLSERLRDAVSSLPYPTTAGNLNVTISVGTALAIDPVNLDCDALTNAADQALYRAKGNGRNRVESMLLGKPGESAAPLASQLHQ
jgi:two-component system, cell cycle response regulator